MKKVTPKVTTLGFSYHIISVAGTVLTGVCWVLCSVSRQWHHVAAGERGRSSSRAAAHTERLHVQWLQHAVREEGGPHCLLTFPRAILQDLH